MPVIAEMDVPVGVAGWAVTAVFIVYYALRGLADYRKNKQEVKEKESRAKQEVGEKDARAQQEVEEKESRARHQIREKEDRTTIGEYRKILTKCEERIAKLEDRDEERGREIREVQKRENDCLRKYDLVTMALRQYQVRLIACEKAMIEARIPIPPPPPLELSVVSVSEERLSVEGGDL